MLGVDGYWMSVVTSSEFLQTFTLDRLPPGTNVYATIALSEVNTRFFANSDNPKFAAVAVIASWTTYQPDGTESPVRPGSSEFPQNAVSIENCARITFYLFGVHVAATAQINVFRF